MIANSDTRTAFIKDLFHVGRFFRKIHHSITICRTSHLLTVKITRYWASSQSPLKLMTGPCIHNRKMRKLHSPCIKGIGSRIEFVGWGEIDWGFDKIAKSCTMSTLRYQLGTRTWNQESQIKCFPPRTNAPAWHLKASFTYLIMFQQQVQIHFRNCGLNLPNWQIKPVVQVTQPNQIAMFCPSRYMSYFEVNWMSSMYVNSLLMLSETSMYIALTHGQTQ